MKKVVFPFLIISLLINMKVSAQSETKIKQDPLIPELMKLKAKMTQSNDFGNRYNIQLASTTFKQANKIKREYESKYHEWPVKVDYEPPNYKVRVGNFNSKLGAERAIIKLKEDFKSALILKPKG